MNESPIYSKVCTESIIRKSLGPPRYVNSKTGDVVRAIVLSSQHKWKEIQQTTGFTEKELNYHLHLLFNDNVIFKDKDEYYITPDLEQEYLSYFKIPDQQSYDSKQYTPKPIIIKKFSLFNLKGIAIITLLLLSLGLNVANLGTIYRLESQLETQSSQIETLTEYTISLEQTISELEEATEPTTQHTQSTSSTRTVYIDVITSATRVIDGDTFEISNGDRVRLADIDAPEINEAGYSSSTDALSTLILDKTVYLDVDDVSQTDIYGRLVCVVYIKSGSVYSNVNYVLVSTGHAVYDDYPNEFTPSDWEKPGIVTTSSAEYVSDSSSSSSSSGSSTASASYVGSKNSDKYHLPTCYWAQQINPSNEIWFTSKSDATSHGYVPCKVCDP